MENIQSQDINALILDIDGVIWKDDHPIGNLMEIFERINALHIRVVLATNNSTRSVDQYLDKLRELGVYLQEWQIVNSAQTAAAYLRENFPESSSIYLIGEAGLAKAISTSGYTIEKNTGKAVAVIVGLDRFLTYEKLKNATLLIRAGAAFIGTNPDRTFPTADGLVPGAGSILAALEAATGIQPVVLGKPNPEIYRVAIERLGSEPGETLVIGDRLETDIQGAQICGCRSAIVLSGVTTIEDVEIWQPKPDIIANDLKEIIFKVLS